MSFTKGPRDLTRSVLRQEATHDQCHAPAHFSPTCGVFICDRCGEHDGLARCFCGWSASGGDGYRELIEFGEHIEEDY